MNFLFLIWFLHFDFSLFESCFSAHYQRTEVGLIFLSPPVLYNWLHAAFPSFHPLLTSHPPLLFSQTGMTLESCAWQPGGGGEPGSSSALALAGRLSPFVSPLPVWLSTLLFLFLLLPPLPSLSLVPLFSPGGVSLSVSGLLQYCHCLKVCFG